MGSGRGSLEGVRRGIRTVFFMVIMLGSLLVFSAPVFVAIADIVVPSALLSAFRSRHGLKLDWNVYNFRSSLIDIPLISLIRSLIIICVYSLCDMPALSHGPYLGTATICALVSVVVLTVKTVLFHASDALKSPSATRSLNLKQSWGMPVMFLSSMVLALGHIVVAYRTSCKARRKLLFHRVDPETVLSCKPGFHGYQKVPRSPTPNASKNSKVESDEKRRLIYEERDLPARMLADSDSLFIALEGLVVHYKIVNGGESCIEYPTYRAFKGNPGRNQCVTPGRLRIDNTYALSNKGIPLTRSYSNNMTNSSLYAPLLGGSVGVDVDQLWNSGFNEHCEFAQNMPELNLEEDDLDSGTGRADTKAGQQKNGSDAVILIHGFGGGVFSWRHVMTPLARQTGCLVAAFDRPGWGLTSRPRRAEWEEKRMPNPYELQSQVNLLFSFCHEMGFSSVVLVGHDDGGVLALMAAEKAQASNNVHQVHVKGVVLVGASLTREVVPAFARILLHTSLGQHMLRPLLRTEISQVANRRAWYDATKLTSDVLDLYKAPLSVEGWDRALKEVGKSSSSTVLSVHNAGELLKAIRGLPVLIAAGAEDILVPLKSAHALASKLHNSRLVAISGCGHLPHEECPKALLAALLPFVNRLFKVSSETSTLI
uniref:TSA: Wollemia nobilis Ref_Wollemi_Transcript_25419_2929 transcribed RNA sequence n=1 Tax=Wollemia nobilis TaxID=56998 RepID=A0A0C9S4B7_9CONI